MNSLKASFYSSVGDIALRHWETLGCSENKYYTPEFLAAFEDANSDIEFNYIIIFKNDQPVAFASTQLVSIGIKTITKNIKISSITKRVINRLFCNTNFRVMFCGNVFLSGEYGTFLKSDEDKIKSFKAIADAILTLSQGTKLNAIFVKDFEQESQYITDHLKDFGFATMRVEPNMIISLDPDWKSFDDYKKALKSKYRIKSNKADKDSEPLRVQLLSDDDILIYHDQLQELYENTIANANFNAQVLNLNTYKNLKSIYHEQFIVMGYFLNDELVGFLSAMINRNHLDAHFIGLNYALNKTYAIYPRILNDYVRLGIENKSDQINLGRTASEIKTTLGAQPKELTCYFRHKNSLINKLIKPFISSITIKSFRQHQPFKIKKEAKPTS